MAQAALDEKIETELIENPALERVVEEQPSEDESPNTLDAKKEKKDVEQKELIVDEKTGGEDDFERLIKLGQRHTGPLRWKPAVVQSSPRVDGQAT